MLPPRSDRLLPLSEEVAPRLLVHLLLASRFLYTCLPMYPYLLLMLSSPLRDGILREGQYQFPLMHRILKILTTLSEVTVLQYGQLALLHPTLALIFCAP